MQILSFVSEESAIWQHCPLYCTAIYHEQLLSIRVFDDIRIFLTVHTGINVKRNFQVYRHSGLFFRTPVIRVVFREIWHYFNGLPVCPVYQCNPCWVLISELLETPRLCIVQWLRNQAIIWLFRENYNRNKWIHIAGNVRYQAILQ